MAAVDPQAETVVAGTVVAPGADAALRRRSETLHFAFRNKKLVIGLGLLVFLLLVALVGPLLTDREPFEFYDALGQPPSSEHWLGTTAPGQDVYTQFVHGLRASFIVGAIAGCVAAAIAMAVGFAAGYFGGFVDDVLGILTNVVLVIPTIAVLIVVAAYLTVGSLVSEAVLIGVTSWPWAARAIRAQTFSLATREFVSLARLSGQGTWRIIVREIAPNMSSYLFLAFILLFGGSILIAATLDFLGLGPSDVMSLGLMLNVAVSNSALQLEMWWWFLAPGVGITAIVAALYVMNVGLDEVFNPKLRKT
jgi:peptide/nickel transport system permease protein